MKNYRIKDGYCPGNGDRGVTLLKPRQKVAKGDILIELYNEIDWLQSQISLLLRIDSLHRKIIWLPKFFRKKFDLLPIQEPELIELLKCLENVLPNLAASIHLEEKCDSYIPKPEFIDYLEGYVKRNHRHGISLEFQIFSTNLNLARLNQIRVGIRKLESKYCKWQDCPTANSPTGKLLNRLSTVLWIGIQKERHLLKIAPNYWTKSTTQLDKLIGF